MPSIVGVVTLPNDFDEPTWKLQFLTRLMTYWLVYSGKWLVALAPKAQYQKCKMFVFYMSTWTTYMTLWQNCSWWHCMWPSPQMTMCFPYTSACTWYQKWTWFWNTNGWKNADRFCAMQNTWLNAKLKPIKTWEIELLNDYSDLLQVSLWDAMMAIHLPTSNKFALFCLIDQHFFNKCYVHTVLKSAMIVVGMLPYLLWRHGCNNDPCKQMINEKWSKFAALSRGCFLGPKGRMCQESSDAILLAIM